MSRAYLDFSKAFNTTSHSMLIDQNITSSEKLRELQSEWNSRLKGLWLLVQTPGSFLVVHPRSWYWGQYCLRSSLMMGMMGKHTLSEFADDPNRGEWLIH